MRKVFFSLIIFTAFGLGFLIFPKESFAASLRLDPSATTVNSGDDLTVKIMMSTEVSEVIDGVDAVLTFDDKKLRVREVKSGGILKNIITKENKGKIQITGLASITGDNFLSEVEVASVKFEILESGTTGIRFDFTAGSTTDSNIVSHGTNTDLLTEVRGGDYSVTATTAKQAVSLLRKALPFIIIIVVLVVSVIAFFIWRKRRSGGNYFEAEETNVPLDELPKEEPEPQPQIASPEPDFRLPSEPRQEYIPRQTNEGS